MSTDVDVKDEVKKKPRKDACPVGAFVVENTHPRNCDMLIQSIPGCKLRGPVRHVKEVTSPGKGNNTSMAPSGIIPGIPDLRNNFEGAADAVQFALDQEMRVTDEINNLVSLAVAENDHTSNNFLQWFVTEQVEEIDTMSTLLQTIKHANGNMLWVEDFVRRNPQHTEEDEEA